MFTLTVLTRVQKVNTIKQNRLALSRTLDQFYTTPEVAMVCVNAFLAYVRYEPDKQEYTFIEPSAGTGSFFNILPDPKIGIDIAPAPNTNGILKENFLEWIPTHITNNIVVIGNPPFGKNSSTAVKFINHAAKFAKHVAFILPRTFEKESIKEKISRDMHLTISVALNANSFIYNGSAYSVPVVFQVWSRSSKLRETVARGPLTHSDFAFVKNPNDANFAFQRVGARAGMVSVDGLRKSAQSHYFIQVTHKQNSKKVMRTLESIDWSPIKTRTAGNPSIGKAELITEYTKAL